MSDCPHQMCLFELILNWVFDHYFSVGQVWFACWQSQLIYSPVQFGLWVAGSCVVTVTINMLKSLPLSSKCQCTQKIHFIHTVSSLCTPSNGLLYAKLAKRVAVFAIAVLSTGKNSRRLQKFQLCSSWLLRPKHTGKGGLRRLLGVSPRRSSPMPRARPSLVHWTMPE